MKRCIELLVSTVIMFLLTATSCEQDYGNSCRITVVNDSDESVTAVATTIKNLDMELFLSNSVGEHVIIEPRSTKEIGFYEEHENRTLYVYIVRNSVPRPTQFDYVCGFDLAEMTDGVKVIFK